VKGGKKREGASVRGSKEECEGNDVWFEKKGKEEAKSQPRATVLFKGV
jgi:hypothetical protein